MNISNKITEKKNDIIRKLAVLELDSRFNELVDILNQKENSLEEKFLIKKSDQDLREYYAELCLFLEQDVMFVMKLYNRHKDDKLSIYDDSTEEINQELFAKEQEIEKCIQDTENNYHDATLTNYINIKYKLILEKFKGDLQDVIERNHIAVKNQLIDNYQELMPLTIYNNCTLVKQRCLEELSSVLDDFINYVNSLIENKKLILEQEKLIEKTISNTDKSMILSQEFNIIKDKYYKSIVNIASIDTRIGMLQKNYFQSLQQFYEKVQEEEKKHNLQKRIAGFHSYLTNANPYEIKFTELAKIKKYLDTNNDPELFQLLCQTYYKVIKLELFHNNGKSLIYNKLSEKIKLVIERLYLNDVKEHKDDLLKNNCYEEFLITEFTLELLTKFVKLDLDFSSRNSNYEEILIDNVIKQKKHKNLAESSAIHYLCLRESLMFDENGEVLIQVGDEYYVANRNGNVKPVYLYKDNYCEFHYYLNLKYHDGILMYDYRCYDGSTFTPECRKFHIIAESKEAIGDDVCAVLPDGAYQRGQLRIKDYEEYHDGVIMVTNDLDDNYYFINKNGKICLKLKKKDWISGEFNYGYVLVGTKRKNGEVYEYLDKKGKSCYSITSKYLEDVKMNEGINKLEYCPSSFKNGYAGIIHSIDSEKTMILDTNFKPTFQDYDLKIIKQIVGNNRRAYNICGFCSKKDGSMYFYENGSFIPMTEEEIEKYCYVGHYALVKDSEGNLSFVEEEQHNINCVFDIVVNQELDLERLINNNIKK